MKEIISSIIIISIVCIASFKLEEYLESTSNELIGDLENLKTVFWSAKNGESAEKIVDVANEILKKWEEVHENWSVIITHEELDLVMQSILEIKAATETGELDDGLKEIDQTIFLINHIKEKESLTLKNIF